MNSKEINNILSKMPVEELIENLAYLIREMPDKEQYEYLGLTGDDE